ncbi:hypothetical protein GOV04_04535 [Candidatus Woesearchaeota archaeon]|nr:hypothetical protein [Candidatus Woesearchaeota archaeon]
MKKTSLLLILLLPVVVAIHSELEEHTIVTNSNFKIVEPDNKLSVESLKHDVTNFLRVIKIVEPYEKLSKNYTPHTINTNQLEVFVSLSDYTKVHRPKPVNKSDIVVFVNVTGDYYDYLKEYLNYPITNNISIANFFIQLTPTNNNFTLNNLGFGMINNHVKVFSKTSRYPFNAYISSYYFERNIIEIVGNSDSGTIAALREFVDLQDDFFLYDNILFVDGVSALASHDYLLENPNDFSGALFGRYDKVQKRVKTNDGIILRLEELTPKLSAKYIEGVHNVTLPIAFAGGLWSDINTWRTLGQDMADSGRYVFLLEITGGPYSECSDCPDYTYQQLIDDFWPALIAGVQAYSNSNKIQYVGSSNGARTAIDSLSKYYRTGKDNAGYYSFNNEWRPTTLTSNPVDTLIAVGVPGAFEGILPARVFIKLTGDYATKEIRSLNITHVTAQDLEKAIIGLGNPAESPIGKISVNLWEQYQEWILNKNDKQPGNGLSVNNFYLIQSNLLVSNDIIVTTKDEKEIYNQVEANKKMLINYPTLHSKMSSTPMIHILSKELLNKQDLNSQLRALVLDEKNK